ncbi:multidrug effflux MFS transporter [Streptomyces winkii]|uniref:multidrug effflux MFS transporter n=1 Tax=Streptomyces winkii TaxID=3051178 RepID=UPI0028D0AA31|nr:multidrug effflux MFS transporter [Streptomyces sp. DSM 40971]
MTAEHAEAQHPRLNRSRQDRGGIRLLVVLAGLSAASPLATDMYVPGLPEVARSLQTDSAGAQVSLTGFLIGIIVGQFVLGPLSDGIGRRPVLLGGTLLFAVFSVLCGFAPTAVVLDVARVGQGIAGAAGIVVARAVMTDLFSGIQLAKKIAALGAITALGPVVAPLFGGAVLAVAPWRVVFFLLALFGLVLLVGVLRWVPESLARQDRTSGGITGGLRSVGRVATRRSVLAPVLSLSFGGAAVFAYIAGTSFVFQDIYHQTPEVSSLVYGLNAVGNMTGSLAYGRLVTRWPAEKLQATSAAVALTASMLLLGVQATVGSSAFITWGSLFVSITAFGVFFPAVTTVAQSRGRDAPGATSALLGSGQFTLGAAASPAVGLFGIHSPAPMAAIMTACLGLTVMTSLSRLAPTNQSKGSTEKTI